MWLPGANTEGYHASKLTEKARRGSINQSCFMAFTLWPQVSGMLAPFIWSWQERRWTKTTWQSHCGNWNSPTRTQQQDGHAVPLLTASTDMLATGTAGHIIICVSRNDPLPYCSLFLQGFQGSSLPSKSKKKTCELRHQLLWKPQLTTPRELV